MKNCEKCQEQGVNPGIPHSYGALTTDEIGFEQTYYDADGKYHRHNSKKKYAYICCQYGHKWNEEQSSYPCPVEGCSG